MNSARLSRHWIRRIQETWRRCERVGGAVALDVEASANRKVFNIGCFKGFLKCNYGSATQVDDLALI